MLSKNHIFGIVIASLIHSLNGSDNSRMCKDIPPLLPTADKIIHDAVVVPESAYYFLPNGSTHKVILGPLSPCVGAEIIDLKTKHRLFVHIHPENSPQKLIPLINTHFGEKHNVDFTLFTRTDEAHCNEYPFAEGSHEKRLLAIADTIQKNCTVQTERIYYHQTPNPSSMNDARSDRWLVSINNKLHRFDPWQSKILKSRDFFSSYTDMSIRKALEGLDIRALGYLPFYRITNLNLKEINDEQVPYWSGKKLLVYSCYTAATGIALGLLVFYAISHTKHKTISLQ